MTDVIWMCHTEGRHSQEVCQLQGYCSRQVCRAGALIVHCSLFEYFKWKLVLFWRRL